MKNSKSNLTDAAFIVLALLAEKEAHGYELEQSIKTRGFQYWTDVQRSSIYLALKQLEERGLISVRIEQGGGPPRKVYCATNEGLKKLEEDGLKHISTPDHPRNEMDLGIYALPFLSKKLSARALEDSLQFLRAREEFLAERLAWCRENELEIPALAFERPLVALRAEITWLKRLIEKIKSEYSKALFKKGWEDYVYKEPP